MVHEGTGLWHDAGFNVSRWLMIIIHGYRATTLLLSILLNVLVRTGEYVHTVLDFLRARVFRHGGPRASVCVSLGVVTFHRFVHPLPPLPTYLRQIHSVVQAS